jgi:predicted Zn-dependent peptidase
VQEVTPADVQRVAKQYFKADETTTGWFVPVAAAAGAGT